MVNHYVRKIAALVLILVVGLANSAWSGGKGTSNAEFLRIPAGAAPAAMGGGYTAIATDVNASFWNPAGLALVDSEQLTLMHLSWFESLYYEYIAYAQPMGENDGFGAHLIYFWAPEFNSTIDEQGISHDDQPGKMSSFLLALSYGYYLGYLDAAHGETAAGITVKVLSNSLMDKQASSFVVDAGILTCSDMGYVVALTLDNLGTAMDDDHPPMTLKLGIGYPSVFDKNTSRFRVACDIVRPIDLGNLYDDRFEIDGGLEYKLLNTIALRIGYHQEETSSGITAGIGAYYSFLRFDYAFVPYGELGYTHRFSISFDFSSKKRKRELFKEIKDPLTSFKW